MKDCSKEDVQEKVAGSYEILPRLVCNAKGTSEVRIHKSEYKPLYVDRIHPHISVDTRLLVIGAVEAHTNDELIHSELVTMDLTPGAFEPLMQFVWVGLNTV